MQYLIQLAVRLRESHRRFSQGQTMTEYALIMSAVAVVVFVTYKGMGNDISAVVNKVNSDLTNAS